MAAQYPASRTTSASNGSSTAASPNSVTLRQNAGQPDSSRLTAGNGSVRAAAYAAPSNVGAHPATIDASRIDATSVANVRGARASEDLSGMATASAVPLPLL